MVFMIHAKSQDIIGWIELENAMKKNGIRKKNATKKKKSLLDLYKDDYSLGLDYAYDRCLETYDFSGPKNISSKINFAYWDIPHCDKGAFPLGKFRCWVYYNEAKIEDDTYTWITSNDGTYKVVSSYEYGEW